MTEVARAQYDGGHDVEILLVSGGVDGGLARRLPHGVSVRSVACVSRRGARRSLKLSGLLKVYQGLRADPPEVVHTHLFLGHTVGRMAALLAGIPVLSTEHSTPNVLTRRRARWLHGALRPLSRQMLAVSDEVAQSWRACGQGFIVTVPGGSVVPACNRRPEPGWTVGVVARLVQEKGVAVVIQALGHLPPAWSLTIVGDGPERERLTALVQALRLSGRVCWAGAQDAIPWYGSFDVLASAATREGYGLAAGEALAAGVPVVLSRLPAHLAWKEKGRPGTVTIVDTAAPNVWATALAEAVRMRPPSGSDPCPPVITWRDHAEELLRIYAEVRVPSRKP